MARLSGQALYLFTNVFYFILILCNNYSFLYGETLSSYFYSSVCWNCFDRSGRVAKPHFLGYPSSLNSSNYDKDKTHKRIRHPSRR